jgi:hypothetical protein
MTYRANEAVSKVPGWRRVLSVVGWISFAVAVGGWIFIFSYIGLI